jgi:hypothetical protein
VGLPRRVGGVRFETTCAHRSHPGGGGPGTGGSAGPVRRAARAGAGAYPLRAAKGFPFPEARNVYDLTAGGGVNRLVVISQPA